MFKIGDKVKVLPGGSYGHCLEIGCIESCKEDKKMGNNNVLG